MDKRQLRQMIISKRSTLSLQMRQNAEAEIHKRLFELDTFKSSRIISSFVSFRDEIEMKTINERILSEGKTLVLPFIDMTTKSMSFYIVNALKELELNSFGILEPNPKHHTQIENSAIDLVLTPGVAFDQRGYRLGYGGGFYDRFFSQIEKTIPKIGIAFDIQLVDALDVEAYDLPVTQLITENGIKNFSHHQL